jgi:hypothetical protein
MTLATSDAARFFFGVIMGLVAAARMLPAAFGLGGSFLGTALRHLHFTFWLGWLRVWWLQRVNAPCSVCTQDGSGAGMSLATIAVD